MLEGGTKQIMFDVTSLTCVGWPGRDRVAVERHMEELEKIGVPRPSKIPMLIPVSKYLLTQEETVKIQARQNSGEVEYVILVGRDGICITIGSDHTSRELERLSIEKSKQACPKMITKQVWSYEDVRHHWDEIVLRSHVMKKERRILYQEARLDGIIDVNTLVSLEGRKCPREVNREEILCAT